MRCPVNVKHAPDLDFNFHSYTVPPIHTPTLIHYLTLFIHSDDLDLPKCLPFSSSTYIPGTWHPRPSHNSAFYTQLLHATLQAAWTLSVSLVLLRTQGVGRDPPAAGARASCSVWSTAAPLGSLYLSGSYHTQKLQKAGASLRCRQEKGLHGGARLSFHTLLAPLAGHHTHTCPRLRMGLGVGLHLVHSSPSTLR